MVEPRTHCSWCQKKVPAAELTENDCVANLCYEGCGNADNAPKGCMMHFCDDCHEMIFPAVEDRI